MEARDLAIKAKKGDREAAEKLFKRFSGAIWNRARYSSYGDLDRAEDLFALGSLAFWEAVLSWNRRKGCDIVGHILTRINWALVAAWRDEKKVKEIARGLGEGDDEDCFSEALVVHEPYSRFGTQELRRERMDDAPDWFCRNCRKEGKFRGSLNLCPACLKSYYRARKRFGEGACKTCGKVLMLVAPRCRCEPPLKSKRPK